jgi:hypothetical protein
MIVKYFTKLLENDSTKSSRRFSGCVLILFGLLTKLSLLISSIFVNDVDNFIKLYDKVDNSSYDLIKLGTALILSTTIDKFKDFLKK